MPMQTAQHKNDENKIDEFIRRKKKHTRKKEAKKKKKNFDANSFYFSSDGFRFFVCVAKKIKRKNCCIRVLNTMLLFGVKHI